MDPDKRGNGGEERSDHEHTLPHPIWSQEQLEQVEINHRQPRGRRWQRLGLAFCLAVVVVVVVFVVVVVVVFFLLMLFCS